MVNENMNKEKEKNMRRIKLFDLLKNNVSFDKTLKKDNKFSAISAYVDKLNEENGISFAIDTENDFVEFILTYDEAKILGEAAEYMTKNIKDIDSE